MLAVCLALLLLFLVVGKLPALVLLAFLAVPLLLLGALAVA